RDVRRGDDFEPDGLPDAGRARIPDRVRVQLPVLLSARLREIVRVVEGADHEFLLGAVRQVRRDVNGEGRVAAFVSTGKPAVYPDGRDVVDCTEIQQQALAVGETGARNGSAVPARAEEAAFADTAQRRFWRERNLDGGR